MIVALEVGYRHYDRVYDTGSARQEGGSIMAVTTRSGRTYQPTDLTTSKRRDFLDEARAGVARLRNSDGETLVALPERDLNVLVELRNHTLAFLSLETAMSRARGDRRPTDFGELAWAAVLDNEDLADFRAEFADGLASALTERSVNRLEETIHAWRLTSDLLRDPVAMARVNAGVDEGDVEVSSPTGMIDESAE
jgi:hypothetical protein